MNKAAEEFSPSVRLLALFEPHRLTPGQRRIAQCLVEHAPEAAYLTSSEVAELAGVSQPSVTRFAMTLGFQGYPELRRRIRTLNQGAARETETTARRNELQNAVAAEISNLERLSELLTDPEPVQEAGRLLAASRPLPVLGLRASSALAHYFGYFAAKIHPDVRVLSTGGTHLTDQLEQAQAAGATGLLSFVLPRYPREVMDALSHAQAIGLTVVTITDSPLTPASGRSDVVLPAAVGSQLVFDSQAAPMMLAMALLQAMADADPRTTQQRLEAFEQSAIDRQLFTS